MTKNAIISNLDVTKNLTVTNDAKTYLKDAYVTSLNATQLIFDVEAITSYAGSNAQKKHILIKNVQVSDNNGSFNATTVPFSSNVLYKALDDASTSASDKNLKKNIVKIKSVL